MPIPLGVLAVAGAGAAGGGSFELIATATGTGSASTISFSSIPSTYRHLQLRWTAIQASSSGSLFMSFNGDTSSVKPFHRLVGTGSAVASAGFTNQTSIQMEGIGFSATSWMSAGIMDILDYTNTSKNKTARWLQTDNNAFIYLKSALWQNTAAITSVSVFTTPSTNFTTATRFSLYGIK